MKTQRILVSLLLVATMILGVFAFAGCESGGGVAADFIIPEGGFDTSKPVTITFYHTMGSNLRDVLDRYIAEFNKLYPNITVQHEQVGSYDDVRDQIKTEITVGNQPNIAYCYPDHVALYNLAQAVTTLDSLIASDLEVTRADGSKEILGLTDAQIADFIKGYYDEGKQFGDGKMYTMPLSKSTEVLYYNKTFFDKHGIKVPTTWDELEAVCEQIKSIDPDSIPLGYDSESNWFITMCEQSGSAYTSATGDDLFLFDNETNRAFVARFREWYQKGYVTTQEISGGYTSELFTKAESDVGNSYMSIGSSAGATHQRPDKVNDAYPFEVGIATIPQLNAANPKVISQGPSLCIFKKNDPQEVMASWLFVKFLCTTVEFQAEFSMASGYVPVIKSVGENPIYKGDFLDLADGGDYISALSAKICLEQEKAYYTSPAFNGSSTARDQVGLLMQKCLSSDWGNDAEAQIKKAFEDAIAECKYQAGN
ncbi:MAG: extracellular solute-binding protein [Clostridia bacterium]|nr:extracellular solute-binding protein [Clostridia bacterium]MBR4054427.1 extracellular solute-binding protein [Clostridia bacterium]